MSVPRLAAVLHGAHWPAGDPAAALRDRLARLTDRDVEVVIARDELATPRGAAACIQQALHRTLAPQVLVLDVHAQPDDALLIALLEAIAPGAGNAALAWAAGDDGGRQAAFGGGRPPVGGGRPPVGGGRPQGSPLRVFGTTSSFGQEPPPAFRLVALIDDVATPEPPRLDDPLVWAVQREALIDIGGLDSSLWSIGIVQDLAARLAVTGKRVEVLPHAVPSAASSSYPLAPSVAVFLRWRNALRIVFRSTPDASLGPVMSRTITACLASAWRATGLDAAQVRFGGEWGRESLARQLRVRLGGAPPDDLWPVDELGTVLPLAALQAFAQESAQLLEERRSTGQHVMATPLPPPVATTDVTDRRTSPTATAASPTATAASPTATPTNVEHSPPVSQPMVSVIVVTWNGRTHLEPCFASLEASDYPRHLVELICVDNGSSDGTAAFMAERFAGVRFVALPDNRGFTGGNEAGVAEARGDVLVFLNNDMRVEPTFLARLVGALDDTASCAAARVMSWDGRRIDFVRGTSSFEARGFQEHYGQPYVPGMALAESFFPNGGAFAVTRRAYDEAGGFDPALFAYYDDLDLGWRLRMMNHGIRTATDASAYHRHGATVATQPRAHKRFLMARNALWTALRNYDDRTLPRVLPALLTLAGLRVAQDVVWLRTPERQLLRPWIDASRRHRQRRGVYEAGRLGEASLPDATLPGASIPGASLPATSTEAAAGRGRLIASLAMPELAAIGATLQDLPRLASLREAQQAKRRVPDTAVLPFLGRPFEELDGRRTYRAAQHTLIEAFGLRPLLGMRPHVVLVTHEALRANMSGPAIRVLEMARALSRTARVTVAAPGPLEIRDDRVALVPFEPARPAALRAQAETADVIVVQGFALHTYPFLTSMVTPIVADLYCPFTLEHLEQTRVRRDSSDKSDPPSDKSDGYAHVTGTSGTSDGYTSSTSPSDKSDGYAHVTSPSGKSDGYTSSTSPSGKSDGYARLTGVSSTSDGYARRTPDPDVERDAASILSVQNAQLQQADFFICASERQRDFWLGTLHTAGRVNPRTLSRDPDLRTLIDVVPFGLPAEPIEEAADRARAARRDRHAPERVLKGVHPAIGPDDKVLLWGGSLLDWQDPETLIEAVALLCRVRRDVKLFFMGVRHPNPQVKPMAVVDRARRLAQARGVLDTHVIFNDWVPYQERALYLCEADLGVSTHRAHLETRYAFRTRMLDYLWARLPIVCSSGDHFGDLVSARGLGRAVPPGDPQALATAIAEMLDNETARQSARDALAAIAATMTWDHVVEPLRRACAEPAFAADRETQVHAFHARMARSFRTSRWLKRMALRIGVKEGRVEAIKQWAPVRAGMSLRNVIAVRRARARARRA